MPESLWIILLVAPLIAGAIAIFFSFQLMKRYKITFVTSYFYYIVFLYIFGSYSLIGNGILEGIFTRMETGPEVIRSVRLFMILLGIPLLVLSKYMLLRSVVEFFQKKLGVLITAIYFILSVFAIFLYAIFTVRLTRFELGEYNLLIQIQQWVFIAFMVVVYSSLFLIGFSLSRKKLSHDREFIRRFVSWYLLFMLLTVSAFTLSRLHEIVPFVFVFIFLSWHLIPILFLNVYLGKYYSDESVVQKDFTEKLDNFIQQFEISKREREVIELISKGMSNQEISEALFISLQTVKDHVHRIFVKTGVKNRIQLTNLIRSGK